MLSLVIFYIIGGLLLAVLALPMLHHRIQPKGFFRFFLKEADQDPEKWYQMNEYAGRRLLTAGIGIALAALLLYAWPGLDMTVESYVYTVTGVAAGLMLWAMVQSYLFFKSLD